MKTGEEVRLVSVPFRLLSVPFSSIPPGKNHGGSNLRSHWHLHFNTQSSFEHSEINATDHNCSKYCLVCTCKKFKIKMYRQYYVIRIFLERCNKFHFKLKTVSNIEFKRIKFQKLIMKFYRIPITMFYQVIYSHQTNITYNDVHINH